MEPKKLTEHFTAQELRVADACTEVQGAARILCHELLEPIRARFGPLRITSGYRPPARNKSAGGKPTSFHLYEDGKAAADFRPETPGICLQEVFDWIRLESGLKFDKVILERGHQERHEFDDCIHIQTHINEAPRRLAFTGETGAGQVYTPAHVNPIRDQAVNA